MHKYGRAKCLQFCFYFFFPPPNKFQPAHHFQFLLGTSNRVAVQLFSISIMARCYSHHYNYLHSAAETIRHAPISYQPHFRIIIIHIQRTSADMPYNFNGFQVQQMFIFFFRCCLCCCWLLLFERCVRFLFRRNDGGVENIERLIMPNE